MDTLTALESQLEFEWIGARGQIFDTACCIIHEGSCSLYFLKGLFITSKLGLRYYISFHLIPMLLRLRNSKDNKQRLSIVLKTFKYYIKSVLFMAFLVNGIKGAICLYRNNKIPLDGYMYGTSSAVASLSIFFQEGSRRREIGYFVLVKALRSIYVTLKRSRWMNFNKEQEILHVVFMSVLFYVYNHQPDILKFRNIFEMLWGSD